MAERTRIAPWCASRHGNLVAHAEARLSESEQADLVAGLVATFGDEESAGSAHED